MANISEKTAFDSVQLDKPAVSLLKFLPVLIQFETEDELPKALIVLKIGADHQNKIHEDDEIEVVKYNATINYVAVPHACRNINDEYRDRRYYAFQKRPTEHSSNC